MSKPSNAIPAVSANTESTTVSSPSPPLSPSLSSMIITGQLQYEEHEEQEECHQNMLDSIATINSNNTSPPPPATTSSTASTISLSGRDTVTGATTANNSVEMLNGSSDPKTKLTIITPPLPLQASQQQQQQQQHLSDFLTPSPTLVPGVNDKQTPPYSIFSPRQKGLIVMIAAMSSFISPFSANIYFPVLNTLRVDLHTSAELISLTVTVYMIFQGLSPSFWGSLSDSWGRRPIYLMTLFIYLLACIGLFLTPNYTTLLVLRMLQAFGSSSVIAIGAGTIGDIAVPSERGGYMGWYGLGSMLGQTLGPVLGGTISSTLGWRWIFGVLAIFSGCVLLLLFFCLPETLRSLVGNGSIYGNPTPQQYFAERRRKKQCHRYHQQQQHNKGGNDEEEKQNSGRDYPTVRRSSFDSALTALEHHHHHQPNHLHATYPSSQQPNTTGNNKKKSKFSFLVMPNPFRSLFYFREKDVLVVVMYNALQYSAFYCILTSVTGLFTKIYGLNEFQIGLCYLANGVGSGIGSFTSGRIMNWQFKRLAKKMGLEDHEIKRGEMAPEFPLEHARMNFTWVYNIIFVISMIANGWGLHFKAPLPPILFLQSLMGLCMTATHNTTNTLLVDLFPNDSAAIVASNNILRCLLGAIAVLITDPGITALGTGWMFTTVSIILFVSRILIIVELKFGGKWRLERSERIQKTKEEQTS